MSKHGMFILFLASLLAFLPWRPALADLTITPIRVVFQGRQRSAEVQLVNITNHTNTYRLGWMKMKETRKGHFELLPDKNDTDPHSVANMVIFTPRQVTIAPHGQQTIRLSLRRPADLPFGEYRAHMSLTRMARQGPHRPDTDDKKVEMSLHVNLGFSIPIIVRSGDDPGLKVELQSPKLDMGGTGDRLTPRLGINITRTAGTFSSYGYVQVFWTPKGKTEREIGAYNNVSLYPEAKTRHLEIPIKASPTNGTLRVVYRGKYESEGKIWDEKIFPIGK